MEKTIKRLLVANRGEIAIRVMRACTEMDIATIAIYTHEDRHSLHRFKADEAYQIGNREDALKPYLNVEEIISLAKKHKIDAIHPGYGFLSENISLVEACEANNIIFVGPSPQSMRQLGDKLASKQLAEKLGVPTIQGLTIGNEPLDAVLEKVKKIGFPVIIKASAGGGGRGMRVVKQEEDFIASAQEARQEAENAFGDATIFVEKYIANPKHIEIQLLGDKHGNLYHLFERDCSVQRRFQKVVEVAPSLGLSEALKDKLYHYAITLGKAVNYYSAGTVEFLVEGEDIYFIEVNPRIQVEHTITEEIVGIDIVLSQLLVAKGLPLSLPPARIASQELIKKRGFAIQCRITTEDPANGFVPDFGTLLAYRNAGGYGIRLDEGSTFPGNKISPYFDSMLVKISSRGQSLDGAARRLRRALLETRIRGVKTNISFLLNVIKHPIFTSGQATVHFIQENPELLDLRAFGDRSTKTLKFFAENIVNSQAELGKLEAPEPPQIDLSLFQNKVPIQKTQGTRSLYKSLGKAQFIDWIKQQKQILYTDTSFRDGHQSLLATRVRTRDMLAVSKSFAASFPNLFSMEAWGGATFDVSMRFLQECPWRRLARFREAMPEMMIQMLIRGMNAVGYTSYPDNLIEKFIEKSGEAGIDVFRIFDSLNWIESLKPSIDAVKERTQGIAEVAICYGDDFLISEKYNLDYYLDLAKKIEDAGADILAIKDMAGLLKPQAAEILIRRLKEHIDLPIHLHTHDTSGLQVATYSKAIDAGVDIVDVALSSLSGLTSQPSFNSVVAMLQGHERECPIDADRLQDFSLYWEKVRKLYAPFESPMKSPTTEVYKHRMPGGQYTNLVNQAQSVGVGHEMERVVENYRLANQLLGDIVKVTPSSKVVGDLAIFLTSQRLSEEDVMRRGEHLDFPASVKGFLKGELGQPPGGFPAAFQKLVLKGEKPLVGRPNQHVPAIDFPASQAAFADKFPESKSEVEFFEYEYLSYMMYPDVYTNFYNKRQEFGDISVVPTEAFFYPLKQNAEYLVEVEEGKSISVKYLYAVEPDEKGMRKVFFELNGQTRYVRMLDKANSGSLASNKKAGSDEGEVGSPLNGRISRMFVKPNQSVDKGEPLFALEAMKMETTVIAPLAGYIQNIEMSEGKVVETGDLVLVIREE